MSTDFEKYDELEVEIQELRKTLPKNLNTVDENLLKPLWELIEKQQSYIELIKDQLRNPR